MGYNPDNECPVCKSAYSDNYGGWIWICRGCGNRFDNKLQEWQEKFPQNLPKAERREAHDSMLGDSRRAVERLLAKIWDNKYEQDKLFLIIDRATGMTPDKLLKKYKDDLYKKEPGDFA